MTDTLHNLVFSGWTLLRRPRLFFAGLAQNRPLGAGLLWLLTLGVLSGLSGLHVGLQGHSSYGQEWWREMSPCRAAVHAAWTCVTDMFWATLLTWLLARMVRETLRLDALFTALAFATLPYALSTLAFPLRDVSWLSWRIWQAVHVGVMAWASLLVCLGTQACLQGAADGSEGAADSSARGAGGLPVGLGRAFQCSLPALLMLWAVGYRAHVVRPTSFRAACPWLRQEGKTVRVYYPPDKSASEVAAIVRGLDGVMQRDCAVLNMKPLPFKVDVFCFADDDLQRRLAGDDEEPDNTAHAFWDCVTISYTTWNHMDNQMAHELCHVLLAARLTDRVSGLLDEGLCEYVAHAAAPAHKDAPRAASAADTTRASGESEDDAAPCAASPIPLRTLARPDVFFDWEQARETDNSEWTHYATGESLVTYLIHQHGMEKFKRFYGRVARYTHPKDADEAAGIPLARAVQEVYGLSLSQLESQWRRACPPPAAARAPSSHPAAQRDDAKD